MPFCVDGSPQIPVELQCGIPLQAEIALNYIGELQNQNREHGAAGSNSLSYGDLKTDSEITSKDGRSVIWSLQICTACIAQFSSDISFAKALHQT